MLDLSSSAYWRDNAFSMILLMLVVGVLQAQPSISTSSTASSLSYEFFRDRVQPIFLAKRPGHARCVECHDNGNPRLQELSPGATTWTEEQSRKNFESWLRVVVPGDPLASRLLMHPLASEAGGDPFHAGGKHWKSQSDPEWLTLAAWVQTGKAQTLPGPSPLDFEYYRSRVEPIFLKARRPDEGSGAACFTCHTRIATRLRLQPLSSGGTSWTEEQSRLNFKAVSRLVVPGDPDNSKLLLHPLARDAGGDPTHTGGKFWTSKDNPEWKTIADWIRKAAPMAPLEASPISLDFGFFKESVQPIFLAKRPGHARCVECHDNGNPRLQELSPGATTWTEEQSRKNFEAWLRVVVPGDPLASRLLMHPLASEAGGDPFHAGGKHWKSQSDPEWQILAAWVRGEKAALKK
jgi:hypothetical protein